MPRQSRVAVANTIYHVLNRANSRARIFHSDADYQHFETLLTEARDLTDMRILSYCVMPNHWHLVLYPHNDTVLSEFMRWLTSTHVRQYRTKTKSIGYGHLYQDRYKSFPTESNQYCQTLIRYVEQNPLRAKLVPRAEDWRWSSLYRREHGSVQAKKLLAPLPVELPHNYLASVNDLLQEDTLTELRHAANKGKPYGTVDWTDSMVDQFDLGHTLRGPGRPKH